MYQKLDPRCELAKIRTQRHRSGRDLKVVITQRNSGTGGGKTTLAGWLCMNWDSDWNADERATLDPNEFISTYPTLPKHSCLLMDEAEELDARRSNAEENVKFSKQWMMMRVRQIDSVLTLPTSSALDKRIKELADIRINVVERGVANVYRIVIDDHNTSDVKEHFLHELEWPDISEHPEIRELDAMKQDRIDHKLSEASDEQSETVSREDMQKQIQIARAETLRLEGYSWRDIADKAGMAYSSEFYRQNVDVDDSASGSPDSRRANA